MKKILPLMLVGLLLTGCNKDEEFSRKPGDGNRFTVVAYRPAPGQFIGDRSEEMDMPSDLRTEAEAIAWAQQMLEKEGNVSLGAFGGQIVVRFEHTIKAGRSGYDFGVKGNPIASSSEPGIVWVARDTDGDGRHDDEVWYELRGSETGKATTLRDYAVTYYRPTAPCQPVRWTDSEGGEGEIDYLATQHKQDYYYPMWIAGESYTLRGTRLEPRNELVGGGQWSNRPYDWGYVDNMGSDRSGGYNRFRIADAIDSKGDPAGISAIDFVRVQTGVNAKSGPLGELSTEVRSFVDLTR